MQKFSMRLLWILGFFGFVSMPVMVYGGTCVNRFEQDASAVLASHTFEYHYASERERKQNFSIKKVACAIKEKLLYRVTWREGAEPEVQHTCVEYKVTEPEVVSWNEMVSRIKAEPVSDLENKDNQSALTVVFNTDKYGGMGDSVLLEDVKNGQLIGQGRLSQEAQSLANWVHQFCLMAR